MLSKMMLFGANHFFAIVTIRQWRMRHFYMDIVLTVSISIITYTRDVIDTY